MGEGIMVYGMMVRSARRRDSQIVRIIKKVRQERKRRAIEEYKKKRSLTISLMGTAKGDYPVREVVSGRLLRSDNVKERFLSHAKTSDKLDAALFVWNHPNRLKYIRKSELGENKNMALDKDIRNIREKKRRKVLQHYNIYQMRYKGTKWEVGLEYHKKGFEQFYFIRKK